MGGCAKTLSTSSWLLAVPTRSKSSWYRPLSCSSSIATVIFDPFGAEGNQVSIVVSSASAPSWSSCMINAAVNSLVMLPMWNASSTAMGRESRTASPLATRSTDPSPREVATTVPGTANVMELVRYEVRQLSIGSAMDNANASSSGAADGLVGDGAAVGEL